MIEYTLNQQIEKEPITNLIYRKLLSYNLDSEINLIDYISLFLFIMPNSLMILFFHLNDKNFNFLFQNYCVFNIFSLFLNVNEEILIIGLLNIMIILTKFSADYETYIQFSYWFDFLGIEPIDI